ncbi:uncharacterized protein ColSpa_06774 [Colletotrichum spaethianum]|uniref:Uncharacterized protein n=1 Tax=Colletotrichum spaethianum TaxID=700344 RepID=A0AA37LHG8_9PEZI|nr:uncharacterized protein ColSpa_06774 [Colletotrichum spaethianum]GKT46593.1 hypothetical protein ColSpa_06774 [Colletotrichum spaethianum]
MSAPPATGVTERMIIPVKGTKEDWKEPLKAYLLALKQHDGYLRTRWGPWSENEQILDLISGIKKNLACGWKSQEAHDEFFASAECAKVMDEFKKVMTGSIKSYFIKFVPYAPRAAIDSPIAECITISGATMTEDEMRAQIDKARSMDGLNDLASGFSVGDVDGGKVFVAALGWESIEKSRAADKSAYIPSTGKVESHHVNFHYPIKGFSVTNTH